ncbi:MAG: hypothetical protein HUU20_21325 [Pirellulales bacterium]|nr:hypothetical protein [Pirellulales bacterium]
MHRIQTTLLLTALVPVFAAAGPVDKEGRPLVKKLGTVALDQVENSPVVFRERLYLFVGRGNFHFVEHDTGRATSTFASGYFGNAFVEADTVYVTVAHAKEKIHMFTSNDLEHWQERISLDLPGFTIYNTSICKAEDKYVMMFEIGKPKEEAGAPFTARFAMSTDLKHWTVTPPECVYTKDRYSAPHCLRIQPAQPGPAGIARGPEAAQSQLHQGRARTDCHGRQLQQLRPRLLRVSGPPGPLLLVGQPARNRAPRRSGLRWHTGGVPPRLVPAEEVRRDAMPIRGLRATRNFSNCYASGRCCSGSQMSCRRPSAPTRQLGSIMRRTNDLRRESTTDATSRPTRIPAPGSSLPA